MSISIGTDPEMFISRRGSPVPVCGLVGGTKDDVLPVPELGNGFGIQEDNVMLEFNTPPTSSPAVFATQVVAMRLHLARVVRTTGHRLLEGCAHTFTTKQLDSDQAQIFGCSPDYNGYDLGSPHALIDQTELNTSDGQWRFCGGHIHLGYANPAGVPEYVVAQLADLYMSLPFLSLDKQGPRRRMYGQAGRYRPTSYGIEYRTPGNWWVFDENYSYIIADAGLSLARRVQDDPDMLRAVYRQMPWADVRECINLEDTSAAEQLIAHASTLGVEVNR